MTSVLGYIRAGSLPSGSGPQNIAGQWCRPIHKPTCCMAVRSNGSCCLCVPTTATCFIIEMWSQGGGGGGGCCCGLGSYGGQGGSYGWVACTTSGTNHILCACVCFCDCSNCGICSGNTGQFSRVVNCNGLTFGGNPCLCLCGGAQGLWCCFPSFPWNWDGGTNVGGGTHPRRYNTWLRTTSSSAVFAQAPVASSSGGTALNFCCSSSTGITPAAPTWCGCAATVGLPAVGAGSTSGIGDSFNCCVCASFSSPYVWLGACGWSDSTASSTPFGCLNNPSTGIANSQYCGGGSGVGGAAYAGGDQAWHNCAFQCGTNLCMQCGNFPGGGGMTTHSQTSWAQPGKGAPGLILMSWC
jgi:hypothetical protein